MDTPRTKYNIRKNIWLRLLIDQKKWFLIGAGIIGLIYIPLHIFSFITQQEKLINSLEK